ncbi:MAG: potassium transporter TrkG [Oscillospiraceae bacterium]|nr:potassium transporter TrkG [Oscillospiraceae bacterium]
MKEKSSSYEYLAILGALAYVIIMLGIIMLVPVLITPFYPDEKDTIQCFVIPGVLSIFAGYLIKQFTTGYKLKNLKRNSGSVIVLLIWLVSILIGSIPFMMTGEYTFTQAIFETTSGFTTTGFTITDVENASHLVLLYRSTLHLFGGVGLILILSSILSNVYGMQLFSAEGHTDRLTPSLLHSARTILCIYLGFIIGGTALYIIFGMDPFDAVNHAISAVATGGFSTKNDSIGYWHSVPIDIVTIVLMLLGATNFMASLCLLKGNFRRFLNNSETKVTAFLLAIVTPIITVMFLVENICPNVLSAIDNAVFQAVSLITTTGLSTINDFLPRASFAIVPIIILMLVGGHTGSTAGGIKAYRIALAAKSLKYDVREQIEPKRIMHSRDITRFDKHSQITQSEQSGNYTYILIYFAIGMLGTFGLTLCGNSFSESFIEFFSALGTVGMSIGLISPDMSNAEMWIIIVGMIIARLEVYIVILGFSRIFIDVKEIIMKRKNRKCAK